MYLNTFEVHPAYSLHGYMYTATNLGLEFMYFWNITSGIGEISTTTIIIVCKTTLANSTRWCLYMILTDHTLHIIYTHFRLAGTRYIVFYGMF